MTSWAGDIYSPAAFCRHHSPDLLNVARREVRDVDCCGLDVLEDVDADAATGTSHVAVLTEEVVSIQVVQRVAAVHRLAEKENVWF